MMLAGMSLGPAAAFAGLMGLVLGSFLNVVAYRLPRGESLTNPPSRCPGCATAVRPYDNVPVLSWLLLRGRCRTCDTPISRRYPLVEAGTAALAVAVVLVNGVDRDLWLPLVLLLLLVPIALIDLDQQIIPNKLTGLGRRARAGHRGARGPVGASRAADRRRGRRGLPARGAARLPLAGWAWVT